VGCAVARRRGKSALLVSDNDDDLWWMESSAPERGGGEGVPEPAVDENVNEFAIYNQLERKLVLQGRVVRKQAAKMARLQRESAAMEVSQHHALAEAVRATAVAKAETAAVAANAELQDVEWDRADRLRVAAALQVQQTLAGMYKRQRRKRKEP